MSNEEEEEHQYRKVELKNGFSLNLDSIPDAILFWKHFQTVTQRRRMPRKFMQREYEKWGEGKKLQPFSHVLFACSFLNLLRVYNNNYLYLNNNPPISI